MQIISFFNHKGGVGKTTMLFNTAIEMGRLGKSVLMVDFDAQGEAGGNLTHPFIVHPYLPQHAQGTKRFLMN